MENRKRSPAEIRVSVFRGTEMRSVVSHLVIPYDSNEGRNTMTNRHDFNFEDSLIINRSPIPVRNLERTDTSDQNWTIKPSLVYRKSESHFSENQDSYVT